MKFAYMRLLSFVAGCIGLALSVNVAAQMPSGHPATGGMGGGADGMRSGKVISHIDTSQYVYLEVNENDKTVWIAAPMVSVKDGDSVRFSNGMVMTNFYSKSLDRTFPAVIFSGGVQVVK